MAQDAKSAIHPLKRKSVKPSSSTVRGMLPSKQFRSLDAAMQSLRAAGLRLDWQWRDKDVGWVCAGLLDDHTLCELHPTKEPLVGQILLSHALQKKALSFASIPASFKAILKSPVEENKTHLIYEFELDSTPERDLFSDFVESLEPLFEEA